MTTLGKRVLPALAILALACGSSGGTKDASGGDLPDQADILDASEGPSPEDGIEADRPDDPAPDAAQDAADDPSEDATDAQAEALDLPGEVADVPEDASLGDPWAGLAGTGNPVGRIVGVASHMSNDPGEDPQRDFEFDQYVDFDGFRIRRGMRWNQVEPADDDWRFDRVETTFTLAREHGVSVLPLLAYGNDWAQEDPDIYGTLDVDLYADYAGHMAAQFCNETKDFELWNEQNITRFWHIPPDPAKYSDLVIASAAKIREACPGARVVFGGMASFDDVELLDTWGFLRRALEARPAVCDAFDAVALHPYTWFQFDPPEHDEEIAYDTFKRSQTSMTTLAREILANGGCGDKAILFTEVGWPTYELTEAQVASYAARSLLLSARDGVEGWYWYTFWDDAPESGGIRPHENFFGLWSYPGDDDSVRNPKPAWFSVKAAGAFLHDCRFARDLGPYLGLPNDVYALVFLNDAGAIRMALWDGREAPDVRLDGQDEGGPDTTFELSLPLPDCATAFSLFDQDGNAIVGPAFGSPLSLLLTPRVQYLSIDCAAASN